MTFQLNDFLKLPLPERKELSLFSPERKVTVGCLARTAVAAVSHSEGPSPSQAPLPQSLIKGLAYRFGKSRAGTEGAFPLFLLVFKCRKLRSLWLTGRTT